MSLVAELKRRNVFKVAAAYIIVGWLIMQAGDTLAPALHLPEWINSALAFFLILGFPLAVFFAWAFEMTPDGIKKEKDVDRSRSITRVTGQKLNNAIIGVLVLALGYFAIDKLVLDPDRDAEEIAAAVQVAKDEATPTNESGGASKSIAVLPFINMSDDEANEYFSDGLSEELLNLLAKIPEMKVAARTSSFHFKNRTGDIADIAEQLKVENILEGSVRKSGNQVRITAQLIQADNGYHLWSETYDRQLDNIFQIQDEIATAVVDALKITLLGDTPKTLQTDPEAYRLYLESQHFHRQGNIESLAKAIELLNQALAIDPVYAPALTDLAHAYIWYAGYGGIPISEGNQLADTALEKALKIDPGYAQAYMVRSYSRIYNKFEFSNGLEDAHHAMKLDPGSAEAINMAASSNRALGRFQNSISYLHAAIELDPVQPALYAGIGITYYFNGNQEKATDAFQKLLSLSPEYTGGHYRLGRVYLEKGEYTEALREIQKSMDAVYTNTGLAMTYHSLGNPAQSDAALNTLIKENSEDAAFQIAEVYGYRRETDKAFEWLDYSLRSRDSGLQSTLGNPAFYSLVDDPRWEQFLFKLGLVQAWRELPPDLGGPKP